MEALYEFGEYPQVASAAGGGVAPRARHAGGSACDFRSCHDHLQNETLPQECVNEPTPDLPTTGAWGVPDPNRPYVPSVAFVRAHAELEEATEANVTELLALNAAQPAPAAPASSTTAAAPGPDNPPPNSFTTATAGAQYQAYPDWCVPASAHNALEARGFNVTQSSLANAMSTDQGHSGTYMSDAAPVMDEFINYYI